MHTHRLLLGAVLLLVAATLCVPAIAFQRPEGSIETWRSDNATAIQYTVTSSYGSGTGDFRCRIQYPSGKREELRGASSPWRNGTASYTWSLYGEEHGMYRATCFWPVNGDETIGRATAVFDR